MALSKDRRLKSAGDFRAVFRNQKGVKAGDLLLKARQSGEGPSRFGVVISKQVAKKAVERNRLRRLLSEALKREEEKLPRPHDVVLVALPGFSVKNTEEARGIVSQLFQRAFRKNAA